MKKVVSIIIILSFSMLFATIINIPADYPTIQEGIDVSVDADTVLVQPGVYTEDFNYNGKNITIASLFLTTQDRYYISQTIIADDYGFIYMMNGEDSTAILYGFSLSCMTIYIENSSPKIQSCLFSNTFENAIYCSNQSNPIIDSCIFRVMRFGNSISMLNSSITILNTLFFDNGGYGGIGGLILYYSNAIIINSVFHSTGPDPGWYGGVISCGSNSNLIMINTIMWDNQIDNIDCSGISEISISNSCLEGGQSSINIGNSVLNWLDGNIDSDPLFISPYGEDNFNLQDSSLCIGAGIDEIEIGDITYYTPEYDLNGDPRPSPAGSLPDIGVYENPFGEPQLEIINNLLPASSFHLVNLPNPFNPSTTIKFSIEPNKQNEPVELIIYNVKGQKIKKLTVILSGVEGSAIWDGTDENNKLVSSGIYFYKMKSGDYQKSRKMLLLK